MPGQSPEQVVLHSLLNELPIHRIPWRRPRLRISAVWCIASIEVKDVSPDELADGIVDGDKDGGIDSFYVFVNSVLAKPG